MSFLLLSAAMVLAAAAAVAVPLWRGRAAVPDPSAAELAYRSQLADLEADLAAGSLAEGDYQAARRDLEKEFTTRAPAAASASPVRGKRGLAAGFALVLAGTAGALYWYFGSWRVGVEGVEAASVPAVQEMVEQLSERLHGSDGDDLQGWEMLGHAYVIMERYPDAVDAYSHAYKLAGDSNADILAGYGESLTLANPADFMDKALPLFEEALQLDPRNAQALWYGGLGALQRGDKRLAVQRWQSLLVQNPPAEYRAVISKYIVEAGGNPAEQSEAAAQAPVTVHVRVTLSPALKSRVRPDETLFVFAESVDKASGPPLAVKRFRVADLPLDITLSDHDAVVPGRTLDAYDALNVTARVSTRGTPEPKAGDLMGQGKWNKKAIKAVTLVIDTVVK